MFLGRGILGQSWVGVSALTLMVFGYLHYQGLLVAPVVPDVPLYLANAVGACALIVALFWFYDLEGDRFYAELVEMRDRAQEASRAKSAFLANTSHEMRTPLSAVIGFADLLRDELESGELSRCNDMVDTIRRNGRHLLSVINDVLDLSRVESGKLQLERGVVSPRELLREVQRIVEPRAHQRGLELQLSVDDAAPGLVAADPTRLRQVLLNLLDNAVRFTDQGKVRIHATAARLGGEPAIAFEVADTGIGMTEAQLRFAFEPFTQADASTTRTRGGTGLGLSISDRIVQLMGGSIEASSVVGEGSSFRVTVPVGSPEQSDEIPTPTRPLAEMGRALEGLRLLLAEDGPDNQRLIRMFVERAGAQVEVAADGIEAVERYFAAELAARPFDAILMDMDMPRMDGYEATRVLRGRGCELPVIALTAHAMAFDRERCLQAGCDEYLSKPVDRSNLVSVIAAFASKPAPEAETPEA
jgi:signal transduction histidine kinase/ActR/RegA family two-component response regulator